MWVLAPEISGARDDIVEVGAQEGSEQADPILIGRHLGEQAGCHRRQTAKLVGTGREQFDWYDRAQAVICPRQPLKQFARAAIAVDSARARRPIHCAENVRRMKKTARVTQLTLRLTRRPMDRGNLPGRLQATHEGASLWAG
ncbi:hypothetical protein SPZE110945_03110 [Sphingomonas zeae]